MENSVQLLNKHGHERGDLRDDEFVTGDAESRNTIELLSAIKAGKQALEAVRAKVFAQEMPGHCRILG